MKIYFGMIVLSIVSLDIANASQGPIQLGNYHFPSLLSESLRQGLTVPVFLKYNQAVETESTKSKAKIADANITYKDGKLFLHDFLLQDVCCVVG